MSETFQELAEIPKDFIKDGMQFINRCTKPDRREFLKISQAVGFGFLIMGAIGYFIKLIHIPVNNILVGGSWWMVKSGDYRKMKKVERGKKKIWDFKFIEQKGFIQFAKWTPAACGGQGFFPYRWRTKFILMTEDQALSILVCWTLEGNSGNWSWECFCCTVSWCISRYHKPFSFHFKTQVSLSSSHMCYHRELVAGTSLLRDPKGTPIILFQIQFFHKVEIESNPEVDENLKEENRWLYRACEFFP